MNKFALAVFALEGCAALESAYKSQWKMCGVWSLYAASNLILAFVKE